MESNPPAARRGGAVRVLHCDDQMDGGDLLRVAKSKPRRVVAKVGLRVAGNDAGDERYGCRSLGEVELTPRRHGEQRAGVLRAPARAVR